VSTKDTDADAAAAATAADLRRGGGDRYEGSSSDGGIGGTRGLSFALGCGRCVEKSLTFTIHLVFTGGSCDPDFVCRIDDLYEYPYGLYRRRMRLCWQPH